MSKTIQLNKSSLVLVHKGGSYARMVRLADGDILCCFEDSGKSYIRRSKDNGKTWAEAVLVAELAHGWAANPELLQLANGWVLFFYNERPMGDKRHYTIQVCATKDSGHT